jgi:hypothetical protein
VSADYQTGEFEALDESAWVYLSGASAERTGAGLRDKVVEACEASGWLTVSCAGDERTAGKMRDPGRFFTGVSHAVEHADVVVTMIGDSTEMSDAELAMAYSHRRPVVAIRMSGESSEGSKIQAMLEGYERGRVLACESVEECADGLRAILADPEFAQLVRMAR